MGKWFAKTPTSNKNADFIGLSALKEEHAAQVMQFEEWAAQNDWQKFHDAHYDWWTFPVNEPSSYQTRYTVYADEISQLKREAAFVARYLRGAELVAASWGWNLSGADYLPHPTPAQIWQIWPVRLYKAARSLQIFGCTTEFESLQKYGRQLIAQGHDFSYHGHNLKPLFLRG